MNKTMRAVSVVALLAGLGLSFAGEKPGGSSGEPEAARREHGEWSQDPELRERFREEIPERMRVRAKVGAIVWRYDRAPAAERPKIRQELESLLSQTLEERLSKAEARSERAGRIVEAARRRKAEILRLTLAVLLDER